ncbi:PTS system mannose/fructose/N-acetylgalactosamine-transporter subunit IIB [Lentilactobacillus sp. SPB1-3]|uniref:PTS system mannose/fructose/N-acetylgalactosamine-transporter subunit IIB n=1 Tax=Lentilactobacillus terminaliae TaxID=3003483 RepID=A0ACD5DGZ8_9LACO|nr:PTS sugar transporter subunit IIB [Lentilactobacillus sp. SPB1-3]MCZ0976874.1 PTS sugar transporter subunit IIB [Lentilactobacillus sp. SPB1-3]
MTMNIALARVDSRLLHGQVATFWTKYVKPNRILVVSDSVVKDQLRKTLISQVAPADVKANVISVDKMISIYGDPKFDSFKALLLTETVADMVRLAQGGVDFSDSGINLGNLAYTPGKKMITDTIAVDDEAVSEIKTLIDQFHLNVYAQQVPGEKPQNVLELINE